MKKNKTTVATLRNSSTENGAILVLCNHIYVMRSCITLQRQCAGWPSRSWSTRWCSSRELCTRSTCAGARATVSSQIQIRDITRDGTTCPVETSPSPALFTRLRTRRALKNKWSFRRALRNSRICDHCGSEESIFYTSFLLCALQQVRSCTRDWPLWLRKSECHTT